jgi:hypothetical protein
METPKRRNAETSRPTGRDPPKADRNAEMTERGELPALVEGGSAHQGSAERSSHASPPADPPTDPRAFWLATEDLAGLAPPTDIPAAPALKIAGPPPFPRGRFPVMGFLATVYEQVSTRAREMGAVEWTADGK